MLPLTGLSRLKKALQLHDKVFVDGLKVSYPRSLSNHRQAIYLDRKYVATLRIKSVLILRLKLD